MPPIHNHYVPACYLKGSADERTGKIVMYFKNGKKPILTSVESVANQTHYWSDETERLLANEVENPANPVLDKIKARLPITNEDKWLLSRYIIATIKRVPDGRARILSFAPSSLRRTVEKIRSRLEETERSEPELASRAAELRGQIDNLPPEFFNNIPPEVWEQLIPPEITREAVQVIHQMRWVFFTSEEEPGFITSDNPVFYTRSTGVRPPNGQLIFPISQHVSLWAQWTMDWEPGYYLAKRAMCDEINFRTAYLATDYIFYSGHRNWVHSIMRRAIKRAAKDAAEHELS